MAQAGLHGLVSLPLRKWANPRPWLMLGIVLGSILPDADNLAVAAATLSKSSTDGLHRTFTHSLFTILALLVIFYAASQVTRQARWLNLGLGLGLGVFMHIVLDLLVWFDGVALLWPLPFYLNLWSGYLPPAWWMTLMQPAELLFLAVFFLSLGSLARQQGTDLGFLGKLRLWAGLEAVLFVVFLVLAYTLERGFLTLFGAVYLVSLGIACGVTVRMRATLESGSAAARQVAQPSVLS